MEPLTAADPRTVGGFRLRARLGAGGMGRVYLATSPAGRLVAVKVIRPELADDQGFGRRFRSEADAARRVSGSYTAPVVAAGVDDSPPWLATAFVPGPSLEDLVGHGPLPQPALWRLAAGLAEALCAIHAAGLVHRDLKPANVLLASDGPRVIDFGIAQAVTDDRLTAEGAVIGTPAYMSPEQVEGHRAGPPTDVFALGCVLGYAASGSSPFDTGPSASPAAVLYRIARAEPRLAAIPAEARDLIAACLAKDPALRPSPAQIAARCAAAGPRGGSPAAFWPDDVAAVIGAQQAAVLAQVQALVSQPGTPPPGRHVPLTQPGAQPAGGTGPSARAGAAERAAPPALTGPATATIAPGGPAVPPGSASAPAGASRRGLLIGAGFVAVAALGGGTAWALSGGSGTGQLGTGKQARLAAKPGTVAWTFPTGQQVRANPTVADGVVYFGGSSDALFAVRGTTGEKAWATSVNQVSATPVVAAALVFATAEQGDFYALRTASGTQAWSVPNDLGLTSFKQDFAADDRRVALALGDLYIRMYHAATGAKVWAVTSGADAGFGQSVALNGDVVYAFGLLGTLVALDAATGSQIGRLGKLLANGGVSTPVVFSGGTMYFGASSGPLYALDTASGRFSWTYQPGDGSYPASSPVVADGMVYFADNNGLVHAVRATDGRRAWTYSTGGQSGTGPGAGSGHVYVPTSGGLQQLAAENGKPGWTFSTPAGTLFTSTPALSGGLVLCGNADGNFYAIRA